MVIASSTRLAIRQAIGRILGDTAFISGAVDTNSTDGTTLRDQVYLWRGGDDEYNGGQLQMNTGTVGNIGLKRWVSDHDGTNKKLTFAALTSTPQTADTYELWRVPYTIEQINALITEAENMATPHVYVEKSDASTFTESGRYRYGIPSGFKALSSIEYVKSIGTKKTIHDCNVVWSELVDADVTATLDKTLFTDGALKLVAAAGLAANDIMATQAISPTDLSGCTEIEITVYSTDALDAGDIRLLLDNTASCASPVETLDIPATAANTKTRHVISLANPQSDTAIISVGLEMEVDQGAFTLYVQKIHAVDANTRQFVNLHPAHWDIVRGSTDYIQLTSKGLSVVGSDNLLRANGYEALTAMSADSSTSEVDPEFIINYVVQRLKTGNYVVTEADRQRISTSLLPGTRFI